MTITTVVTMVSVREQAMLMLTIAYTLFHQPASFWSDQAFEIPANVLGIKLPKK